MRKILITGGNGYIAKAIQSNLLDHYDILTITRSDFDLTNSCATNKWFENQEHFDCVIHTAAVGGNRLQLEDKYIFENNIGMYNNLYNNKDKFDKMIFFGSGADSLQTPYGKSKKIISESINNTDNFYNIRIFAVFDHNENNRRFIKSNIIRYIQHEPMIIHQDKYMDFFYMTDLISLVKHYINNYNIPKQINCSYDKKYKLSDIANIINRLDSHKVEVLVHDKKLADPYNGQSNGILNYLGLEYGIKQSFMGILHNYDL